MSPLAPYTAAHEPSALAGAGDARPTALQIVKDQGLIGKLTGKVMLVTGCSPGGLGVETARALHATGADVYMTVRTLDKGKSVVEDIKKDGYPGKLELVEMSLDSFGSVKKAAESFLSKSKTLNVLVNNAAVMACPEGTTEEGFETQFGTNHLGHFLLFQLLKSTLLASSSPSFASRVVNVSSTGHRNSGIHFEDFSLKTMEGGYNSWAAYGQSKTANIYMASELERRYGSKGLHSFSLMPGGIMTPLQRHLDPCFMEKAMENKEMHKYIKSTEQGAATTVWAAIGKEFEGKPGTYLENLQVSVPMTEKTGQLDTGYAKHAFDEEKEKRLWVESLKMVGMSDDQ